MKKHLIQSFLLVLSVVFFAACGTDSKENPPEPDGPYSFFDATTPLKITKPTEVNGTISGADHNISVTLLEYNLAKSGEEITMVPFSSTYGKLASITEITDQNGRVTFFYTAPSGGDYDDIRGQDITIQALYLESDDGTTTTSSTPSKPDVVLTQDFVLQFR